MCHPTSASPVGCGRDENRPPNMRMKLAARGGRVIGKESFLSAAAAGRSLCAIR